jgi:hypothetical protein
MRLGWVGLVLPWRWDWAGEAEVETRVPRSYMCTEEKEEATDC